MWGRHLILDSSACDREAVRDAGAIPVGVQSFVLRARLTPPVRLWTRRSSGALMLLFAGFLALRLA